jgi:ribosomal protein S12 methylthiotransferase accessory factor
MEALVGAVAEQTAPLIACTGSIADMAARGMKTVPLRQMQRCRSERIDEGRIRSWVAGSGLFSGEAVHAPYELVGLDMRADSAWDHATFLMSTIGLAAGATREQATLHAICELVENDATTMIDLLGVSGSRSPEVDCSGTKHPGLRRAIAAVGAAGMRLRFFDVTGVIPIPVVACFLEAPFMGGRRPSVGLSAGFACRPYGEDAALAALLEAVQSRLTKIAGSREDLSEASYAAGRPRLPEAGGDPIPVSALAMAGVDRAADMLASVAATVRDHSSAREIHVFPLLTEEAGFSVTRVLIPDLETVADDGVVRLGSHAIRRLLDLKGRR